MLHASLLRICCPKHWRSQSSHMNLTHPEHSTNSCTAAVLMHITDSESVCRLGKASLLPHKHESHKLQSAMLQAEPTACCMNQSLSKG